MIKNMLTKLNKEEKQVWDWGINNDFSPKFLNKILIKSRISSIERFVSAFIRENIGNIDKICEWFSLNDWRLKMKNSDTECLYNWSKTKTKEVLQISLKNSKQLIFPIRQFPLKRFYLTSLPILKTRKQKTIAINPEKLFSLLFETGKVENGNWEKMRSDFLNSNSNLFLSYLLRKKYSKGSNNYIKKLYYNKTTNKNRMLVFFEQWGINGHFLHPTPKSKPEISFDDLLRYSPETCHDYNLRIVGLKNDKTKFMAINNTNDQFLSNLPLSAKRKITKTLNSAKYCLKDYHIIPIHPWQYVNVITKLLPNELSRNDYILIGKVNLRAKPLVAYRTVYLPAMGCYLKMPLDVQITSVKRTLSSKPCHNGVVMSRALSTLIKMKYLPRFFNVQLETASTRLDELSRSYLHKNLSFVIRDGDCIKQSNGDLILPAMSLFEQLPGYQSKTILEKIIEIYARKNKHNTGNNEGIVNFFSKYIKNLLIPTLGLLTKYGIGLEAHLQNSLIVFKNGIPYQFIYRDLDAVNVCNKRFNKHIFLKNEFYHDSWTLSDSPKPAQDKVMHSLIHSHIAEIINKINLIYDIKLSILWKLVSQEINCCLNNIAINPYYSNEAMEDIKYFYSKNTDLKALFKMKLLGKTNEYIHVKSSNPLFIYKVKKLCQ